MRTEIHNNVGPIAMPGHEPVVVIYPDHERAAEAVYMCLECGWTTDDIRMFSDKDCDPGHNTVSERLTDRYDLQGGYD